MSLPAGDTSGLSPPRIICAATVYKLVDGREVLIPGPRHNSPTMVNLLIAIEPDKERRYNRADVEEGFIDQHGRFYNRMDAWFIAVLNDQIVKRVGGDGPGQGGLYSENLY